MRPVRRLRFHHPISQPKFKSPNETTGPNVGSDRSGAGSHHDLHHSRLRSNPLSSEKASLQWRISGKKEPAFGPRGREPRQSPRGRNARDGAWKLPEAGRRSAPSPDARRTAPRRKTPDGHAGPSGVGIAAAIEFAYALAISALAGGDPLQGARHPRAASPRSAAPE